MIEWIWVYRYITLALSLHAPTQEMRCKIVPSAKQNPLDELMAAVDAHIAAQEGRVLMMEYILLAGLNDTEEAGHALGELLKDRAIKLNLIPYVFCLLFSLFSLLLLIIITPPPLNMYMVA